MALMPQQQPGMQLQVILAALHQWEAVQQPLQQLRHSSSQCDRPVQSVVLCA